MSQPQLSFDHILRALKASPLFNLSLASKELFHSNFLAWLCQQYPNDCGGLFAPFLDRPHQTSTGLQVYRERHNIDLMLVFPHGEQLIVENKIKSLPFLTQLDEYAAKFPDKAGTHFLLLSLAKPFFLKPGTNVVRLKDDTLWHYWGYGELAEALRQILPAVIADNTYHGQILTDYITFISNLGALSACFRIGWTAPDGDFFQFNYDVQSLAPIRLRDMIEKMHYAQLAGQVTEHLLAHGFEVRHDHPWSGKEKEVFISSGMTRSTGLFDLKYILLDKERLGAPLMLGVQLQGNALRLVVELWQEGSAKKVAEHILRPVTGSRLWFDFALTSGTLQEFPKKGGLNKYGDTFFYRSVHLPATKPQDVVELIGKYALHIRDHHELLRRQVEDIIPDSK